MDVTLDCFLMIDKPVTCPNCGNRTDFDEFVNAENNSIFQIHQCIDNDCLFKFEIVEL